MFYCARDCGISQLTEECGHGMTCISWLAAPIGGAVMNAVSSAKLGSGAFWCRAHRSAPLADPTNILRFIDHLARRP